MVTIMAKPNMKAMNLGVVMVRFTADDDDADADNANSYAGILSIQGAGVNRPPGASVNPASAG